MVRTLLAIIAAIKRVWLLELIGAGLIVAGAAVEWTAGIALLVGGGLSLLKAFDLTLEGRE